MVHRFRILTITIFLGSPPAGAVPYGGCSSNLDNPGVVETRETLVSAQSKIRDAVLALANRLGEVEDPLISCDGGCIASSRQIYEGLSGAFDLRLIEVQNFGEAPVVGAPMMVTHHFGIDEASVPGTEIIIDGTYRQFFARPELLPEVFVGSRAELEQVFRSHQSQVRMSYETSPPGGYDPVATAEVLYGYGRGGPAPNQFQPPRRVLLP